MAYKLNLVEVDSSSAVVTGSEFAIEDRESGSTYVTTKPYINKLFKLMGYKSLGVVKILEEYTGKTISQIGDIKDNKIYVDDTTQSFVVTSPDTVSWVNDLLSFFKDNEIQFDYKRSDTCYYWDELTVTMPTGNKFAIYIDLCDNYIQVLALNFDDNGLLTGVIDEGQFSTLEGDASFTSLVSFLTNKIDISPEFLLDQKLSLHEFVELLRSLGYVSKKRKKYYRNDTSEEIMYYVSDLDYILDEYNSCSWIQSRTREVPGGFTFREGCNLITMNLKDMTYWKFLKYYMSNARETSDFFALNY